MPFSLRLGTVIYYTRLIAYRSMDFVTKMLDRAVKQDLAAEFWKFDIQNGSGPARPPADCAPV